MKKSLLLLTLVLLLTSCAGHNPNEGKHNASNYTSGFFNGLLDGAISPVTWIISLFNSNVSIYEVNNNGGWYNTGFMLGIGALGGGASSRR